jgi:uncharacterized membrane protein YbaN (DUF454 family)
VLSLILRFTLAFISVLVGIAGLLLPILPGWLFFGIAALLLFPEAPLAQRVLEKIEIRFPSMKRLLRFLTRDGAA